MKYVLPFFLFLIGCGPIQNLRPAIIDPALVSYLNQYVADKSHYTNQNPATIQRIDITFFTTPAGTGADCTRWSTGYRRIRINPGYWYSVSPTERLITFYHEMGHCDLNLEHNPTYSIMYFSGINDVDFINNRDYYLKQLFKR